LTLSVDVAQKIHETLDPVARLQAVAAVLRTEAELSEVQATIQTRAKEEMSRVQREYFLREQLRQIRVELGDSGRSDLDQLRERLKTAALSEEAAAEAERQLRRLEQMHADGAEAGVLRTYLEWLADLPWKIATEDRLDLRRATEVLDEDHQG